MFGDDLQALRGGTLSFDAFAQRHANRFRRWAAHFYGRWPTTSLDLEDLVQEGLIEAWRAVDEWRPDGAPLERFVEFRVGRKLRVELERVLGWPKKSRGQVAVRPLSMSLEPVSMAVGALLVDTTLSAPDQIQLAQAVESLKDPMSRDVVAGVGMGMSLRVVASRIYADPDRREAYGLESEDHTLLRVHAAGRRAVRDFVHPGGQPG